MGVARDSQLAAVEVAYWRTASGEEVDFVIEADNALLPIEVKATRRPTSIVSSSRSFWAARGRRSACRRLATN